MRKKLIIIDYNGMPYRYIYGGAPQLFHNNGVENVNTTIPAYTIKEIVRLSEYGTCPLAVVVDKGRAQERADLLMKHFGKVYKEGRKRQMPAFYAGINLTVDILQRGGVSVYREEGIEADDIIYNLARKSEQQGYEVCVFTNDSDLLCLVNENISVYLKCRQTIGEHKNYMKITKDNFESCMEEIAGFRGYWIPYNTSYLFKLLRGDKADNLPAFRGYGCVKYNELITLLDIQQVDFSKFRPETFNYIMEVFSMFEFDGVDAGIVEHMQKMHCVMNFDSLEVSEPNKYGWGKLQAECSRYGIRLPREK